MKLHQERKGPRFGKTIEVLQTTEAVDAGCHFDPEHEISKKILQGLEKLIQNPKLLESNTFLRDLLLLGIVLPQYRSRISEMEYRKIDGEFVTLKDWLIEKFASEYQNDMGWGDDSGKSAIIYKKIAQWIYFFPDLPEDVSRKLRWLNPPNLGEAVDQTLHTEGMPPGETAFSGRLSALIQLFPKERPWLTQEANVDHLYEQAMDEMNDWYLKEGLLLSVLEGCSELALIYPEHKGDILDFIRPYWGKIKETVKEYGKQVSYNFPPNQFSDQMLDEYVDAIRALTFLSSTVEFSPERIIKFSRTPKSKLVNRAPSLPDRLVA